MRAEKDILQLKSIVVLFKDGGVEDTTAIEILFTEGFLKELELNPTTRNGVFNCETQLIFPRDLLNHLPL
ncbi:MAG: hypothetical protein QXE01_00095 [Sulfolobales archaeon]